MSDRPKHEIETELELLIAENKRLIQLNTALQSVVLEAKSEVRHLRELRDRRNRAQRRWILDKFLKRGE